jgi:hypothetical protein
LVNQRSHLTVIVFSKYKMVINADSYGLVKVGMDNAYDDSELQ